MHFYPVVELLEIDRLTHALRFNQLNDLNLFIQIALATDNNNNSQICMILNTLGLCQILVLKLINGEINEDMSRISLCLSSLFTYCVVCLASYKA